MIGNLLIRPGGIASYLELSVPSVVLLLSTYWLAGGMPGGAVEGCPIDLNR